MDIKYRLYPYPVLWDKNDDFNNSSFECDIDLNRDVKRFILNLTFKLKNQDLKDLIERGKAEYLLHIESSASSYRMAVNTSDTNKSVYLEDEHLLGKVSLCPFIVAKEDIEGYTNKDFNEDYKGITFNLSKGTILAIGTQQIFKVDKENDDLSKLPSVFTVYKKETAEDMPMEIEINNDKIRIGLNIPDYENYYACVQTKPNIVNAFIIYPAIIYAFERLKEAFDEYKEYRWFMALEKMMKKYGIDLDEDLISSKSSVELAQKIMNFPVKHALSTMINEDDNGGEE